MHTSSGLVGLALGVACVLAGCGNDAAHCLNQSGFICTIAGTGKAGLGAEREPAIQTELFLPQDVALRPGAGGVGGEGGVIVLDWNNHRVREIDGEGRIHTILGTGRIGDGVDGPALQTELNHPTHVAFDRDGRLVLSAWQNFKVMRLGDDGSLTTIAGTGKRGFAGDEGPATSAQLDLPANVAFAADGSMFIGDQGNQRVRRVDPQGVIHTVVGTGEAGYGGDDGPALDAKIQGPSGQTASPSLKIALDAEGNLYVADSGNHRVRKVDSSGVIRTIAGTGVAGYSGDGGPAVSAELSRPTDLAFGPDGSLFIADTDNSCIRRVDLNGIITTVAGRCGTPGYDGDDQPATRARLSRPFGIEVGADGTLYIADTYNHRIRVVVP